MHQTVVPSPEPHDLHCRSQGFMDQRLPRAQLGGGASGKLGRSSTGMERITGEAPHTMEEVLKGVFRSGVFVVHIRVLGAGDLGRLWQGSAQLEGLGQQAHQRAQELRQRASK